VVLYTDGVIAKAAGVGKRGVTRKASLGAFSLESPLQGHVESQQT
jgi:hypothetical protein